MPSVGLGMICLLTKAAFIFTATTVLLMVKNMNQHLLERLNWRYGVKQFDPTKSVSDEDLELLLEAQRMTPTSFGLQPWKTVIVTDSAVRQRLREQGGNQPQFTDSAALLVLCARTDIDLDYANRYLDFMAETRGVSRSDLGDFENEVLDFIKSSSKEELLSWARDQVFITLGFMLLAAAEIGVDTCALGGFDPQVFSEVLNLEAQNLVPTVLLAVGHRSADDPAAKAKKVRLPSQELFVRFDDNEPSGI